jgi:hypothetical protein
VEDVPIGECLGVVYVNWAGERAERRIRTLSRRWGSCQWHPIAQWLIEVIDLDKGSSRTFAESGIESWTMISAAGGTSVAEPER